MSSGNSFMGKMSYCSLVADEPEQAGRCKCRQRYPAEYEDADRPSPAQEGVEIIGIRPRTADAVDEDVQHIAGPVQQRRDSCDQGASEGDWLPSDDDELCHGKDRFEQMEEQIASFVELRVSVQRPEKERHHCKRYRHTADGGELERTQLGRVPACQDEKDIYQRYDAAEDVRQDCIELEILQAFCLKGTGLGRGRKHEYDPDYRKPDDDKIQPYLRLVIKPIIHEIIILRTQNIQIRV